MYCFHYGKKGTVAMKLIKYNFLNYIISITIITSLWTYSYSKEILIRHLKPPKLELHNWGKQILCHRPMRLGSPKMEIEHYNNKIIAHNYGFGGSGWTLAPGSAHFIVNAFKTIYNPQNNLNDHLQESIVVIGAGALGLFTEYELIKNGYANITIIAEQFENLTSHNAGGFLAPSTMEVDAQMQQHIETICFDAYRFYAKIAHGENNDFPSNGALIMPIYLKRYDTRLKTYEGIVMNEPQDVIIDFDNGKHYEMKVYDDGIFMNTNAIMQALTIFLKDKVHWVQQHITAFDEIDASYIFNCSGLGAKNLNQDNAMISVQGHLMLLKNQNPDDMNYMISFYVDSGQTESGQYAKRSIYMFPKHIPGDLSTNIGVMGGTFIENATDETPNQQEFNLIIQRASEFFGSSDYVYS